jgi:Tfp pilus assembly protein PilF
LCQVNAAEALDEQAREDLKKPVKIQDLAYGEILFDYYRNDEISALTHILIAQKHNELGHHGNSAELLSGVIYLNLGMLAKAQGIFNRLLTEKDLKNELLAKLEFYLAKLHYKQGDYQEAKRRLSQVYASLELSLRDESLIMLSNIALSENQLEQARQWLEPISNDSEFLAYSRFNLGILWLKAGELEQALPFLGKVFLTIEPTATQRSLQDKAKIALGYYYLKQQNYDLAKAQFLSVRLDSSYTNKALLGIGWVYAAQEQYQKALTHWLTLAQKDLRDIAVQEGLLAIPYAYQKLEAMRPALQRYLAASQAYQEQIELVDDIEEQVRFGNLVENLVKKLIKAKSLGSGDESIQDSKLFGDVYDYYIYELLAQNRFNEGFRSYQKLGRLALMLEHWESQLPMFEEMLETNQLRFDQKIPQIDAYLDKGTLDKLRAKYDVIEADIVSLKNDQRLYLIADQQQTEIHQRITRLEANIKKIPASMLSDNQAIKAKRARGVLQWQLGLDRTKKIWELEKVRMQIEQLVADISNQTVSLASARENALTRFVGYQGKIDEGGDNLRRLRDKIKGQVDVQSDFIKDEILAVLKKRRATLNHFLLQSDLSVARLHEKAVLIQEVE